jgi:hypothetical protein
MNSKGKIVVKVHHKIGAKSMMLALLVPRTLDCTGGPHLVPGVSISRVY